MSKVAKEIIDKMNDTPMDIDVIRKHKAYKYAKSVVDEEIIAGKYVKKLVKTLLEM